jgi:hypothetical protein
MADPNEPPPIKRSNTSHAGDDFDQLLRDQEAEDQRQLELYEAQEKTKQLRALFANRVYIQPDGKHLRISFGERVADEDLYHSAIVVPLEEALQIGELMTRMAVAGLTALHEQFRQVYSEPDPEEPSRG